MGGWVVGEVGYYEAVGGGITAPHHSYNTAPPDTINMAQMTCWEEGGEVWGVGGERCGVWERCSERERGGVEERD